MRTATTVSTGKPNVGGAVFHALLGASAPTLPTTADGNLASGFTELGYCSEDGLKNTNSPSVENTKAWGGDIVMSSQTEKEDSFSLTLIEVLNVNVLKVIYGSTNVSGTLSSGISVSANNKEPEEAAWVIDMVMRGNALKRVVIPHGKVTEISEITYNDTDAVGYAITISAMPDSSGNTHYEYIKAA